MSKGSDFMKAIGDRAVANGSPVIVEQPTPEVLAERASKALTGDGDTFELPDGRTIHLLLEHDMDTSVNDYDSDGRVQWVRRPGGRPQLFDGAARIIDHDGDYALWWQPPGLEITGTPWSREILESEGKRIRELVLYGFTVVVLRLCDGQDYYGHPVVRDQAALAGCDLTGDDDRSYLREVVADLFRELSI